MGCGASNDKPPPRRPRPQEGEGRGRSRDHPDRPGMSHVVRKKDKAREEPKEEKRPAKKDPHTSFDKNGIPIFKIPKNRKEKLIPNLAVFAKRDKWAEKAPPEACRSVRDLAEYLAHEAKSDLEAVRAIYRWIALNICYDAESYLRKTHRFPSDPEAVLQYRMTVCDGYSKLFEALCKAVEVPCKYVAGFSKGTSYDPEIPITESSFVNHAWNIVCVKGEWWPVDVTWGAGFMDKNRFIWHYNELNFLTDPDIFILSHFPYLRDSLEYSEPHQLLKKPITLELFNQLVKPDRNGLEWGLELLTHKNCTIDVVGEVEIKFRTNKVAMTNVSCNFNRRRTGESYENHVLIYQKDGVFIAKVKPPTEGTYKLMLFGETEGMTKQQGLVNYIIHCEEAEEYPEAYPDHFGMWGPQPNASACGFDDDIQDLNVFNSNDGNLKISIPLKERVDTIVKLEHSRKSTDLEDFVSDASNDKAMVIIARLPYKGYYKMQIYANDPEGGGNSYVPAVFFFITCRKGLSPVSRFSGSSEAQQFLQKESSKSRKKKPKNKRPPTPPPPEPEEEDEEDEDEEEEEGRQQDRGRKRSPEKLSTRHVEEKKRPDDRYHNDKGKSEPGRNNNDRRNKAEDADEEEYIHEPTIRQRSSNSKEKAKPEKKEVAKASSRDQDRQNSGNQDAGQQELKYDQQGNAYDQFGNLVQPAVKFDDIPPEVYDSIVNKNKGPARTTPPEIQQNHSRVHDPYREAKAPEKSPVRSTNRNRDNEDDDDDDEDDEDDDEDDDDDDERRHSTRREEAQIQENYPSQLSTVTYVDPYSGRAVNQYSGHRTRHVVPAVEEPSDDEEEEEKADEQDDDEDDDESDNEEQRHGYKNQSRDQEAPRHVREPSNDRYEDVNERDARKISNESDYWSSKSPKEPERSNNVTADNNDVPRTPEPRNLYVPYRGVRRMPPQKPSQPRPTRQNHRESDEDDDDEDDDEDEDESPESRGGHGNQLHLPQQHYDQWNQALGSSSPNSYYGGYGQTGYDYASGRFPSSPQDFSTPYPTQNSYRHLSTVHRP